MASTYPVRHTAYSLQNNQTRNGQTLFQGNKQRAYRIRQLTVIKLFTTIKLFPSFDEA